MTTSVECQTPDMLSAQTHMSSVQLCLFKVDFLLTSFITAQVTHFAAILSLTYIIITWSGIVAHFAG